LSFDGITSGHCGQGSKNLNFIRGSLNAFLFEKVPCKFVSQCTFIGERNLETKLCDNNWAKFKTQEIANESGAISFDWDLG
jgi:hypothetical protein